jgi:septal ring factor EnvC (AmiA/AmiB activator)
MARVPCKDRYRHRQCRFIGWLTGLLLALATLPAPAADTAARLADLRQRIQELEQQLSSTEGERDVQLRALALSERRVGELVNSLRIVANRIARHDEQLDTLQEQERVQRQQLGRERHELAAQLRAAYAMGRQERLKLLLQQQQAETLSRLMHYYDHLNRARGERMQHIEQRIQTVRTLQQQIAEERQLLQTLQQQRDAERVQLEQAQAARRTAIAALEATLDSGGRELNRMQRDQRQLERLLEGLRGVLADIEAELPAGRGFAQRRGALPWPTSGTLDAAYGQPRKGDRRWDGVMIGAREGAEIRAVHRGRVAFADWLRGFGLLIILDHGDGYMTLYGHNQSLFKEVGDWVEAGETLAAVGSSGGREEPAVYFAIRHQGVAEDPGRWCRQVRGRRVG